MDHVYIVRSFDCSCYEQRKEGQFQQYIPRRCSAVIDTLQVPGRAPFVERKFARKIRLFQPNHQQPSKIAQVCSMCLSYPHQLSNKKLYVLLTSHHRVVSKVLEAKGRYPCRISGQGKLRGGQSIRGGSST